MSATAAAAGARGGDEAPRLPPLRDELRLEPGPTARDGAPSWTLADPVSGRYFRIGWAEFEILRRWHLGDPAAIAARVARDTTLRPTNEDIQELAKFLMKSELVRGGGEKSIERMLAQLRASRKSWPVWAVKNYLFVRLPLFRPDAVLDFMARNFGWIYTRGFLALTLLSGLLGFYLAARQWESFAGSFVHFFSLEGALLAFLSVALAKILHEFGHGVTAKRFGCDVPTTGLAFMVMYPTLYTDTTSVWRLNDRRKRVAVAAAGMAAELGLACYALLAWNFLPDGPLRSVVFIWATSSWILTLAVNLSPFMRFDGYYLFSDLIDVPNLQERAFALARWRLREFLFGGSEPAPEAWPARMRLILLGYAFGTWIYRFTLFLGIAFLVYHMFFKLLGIVLFAVEIWWFLLRPIVMEIVEWAKLGTARRMGKRAIVTFAVFGLLIAALIVPWRASIGVPAVLGAEQRALVVAPVGGRLVSVDAAAGDDVAAGATLVRFDSPDLDYRLAQAERLVAQLRLQAANALQEADGAARAQILRRELDRAEAERVGLAGERARLTVTAPFKGTVMEIGDALTPGEWVQPGEALAVLADMSHVVIDAYIAEADLARLTADASAWLVLADPQAPRIKARVVSIADTATRALADAELASIHGGHIGVRPGPQETLIPETPIYRVRLAPEASELPRRVAVGTAWIDVAPESILRRIWNIVLGVLIRESGF
ncbi:MAG: efflux RND transporter periplasmic adaptor subunit [Alphaproteobacteria bacterium]|nr:efflux RND transporter periplasmic adaptor subunit [Alphaproteobacteria bacterium]